jgi:uncharacterized OB-fold protein
MAHTVNAAMCRGCGKPSYPTHFYCPVCSGTKFDPVPIEGEGKLLTFTRVYALSLDYEDLYITLGIVELDMGIRALGRLDIAEPVLGARVRSEIGVVREIAGNAVQGLIFRAA